VYVCVIGRPNVGKSSLVNAFLGSERVIVSERAGTTRDAIDTELELAGRRLVLVDTAGLRRRTKVAGTVAYYAQLRSERAARRADVALVVCDASEGVTSEDLRVAELAMKSGCATLVALNKWDIGETDLDDATARLEKRLRQRPPVIACSATGGRSVPKLLERAVQLADKRASRIGTSELNRFIGDLVASRPPPSKANRRLRVYYAAQVDRRPPRFAIQVNDRRLISREWAFHLENRLREAYGLEGVPIVIDFVPHSRRARPRSGLATKR
jgi:GTP-binding protein